MKGKYAKTVVVVCAGLAVAVGVVTILKSKEQNVAEQSQSKQTKRAPNRLIQEKSPYLLQHADNPVDWYAWGDEAFEKARNEDKPIFLSIGYSTCHWCHVMEHESFEDEEVARLMNEVFVCIKVDREERPDIDNVYMTVCQMMTGSGGWPLTIIMTPDKKPFFAGTYIPKTARFGRAGMLELIPQIKEQWANRRDELVELSDRVGAALGQASQQEPGEELDESTLKLAYEQLEQRFDGRHGGFGRAPKFPTPHNLLFLLRYWKRSGDAKALAMVERTLQAMRAGGIHDHVGFGFHRYSTDAEWLVPHFEKMLYDQAMLGMAYTQGYQATGKEEYARTAREIFAYVLRDMTGDDGGFYSAEDADSEGEEGKFYLWTEKQIRETLGKEEADLIIKTFSVEKKGTFVQEASGAATGENILHLRKSLPDLAAELKMSEVDLQKQLEGTRGKLFARREKRIHPGKDDKILTDWNGLMIAALAEGGRILGEPGYTEEARRAADFIFENMRSSDGRLLHRYRDGHAGITGQVNDYAFLIWGLLELYESTFEVRYLQRALELNAELIEHFWDDKDGGFYFTSESAEKLLIRQKESYDGAVPSGNSVAMLNLLRLGRITAKTEFENKAARIGRAFSETVGQIPSAHTQLLSAVDFAVGPAYEVVIVGNSKAEDTKAMLEALHRPFLPNKVVILRAVEQASPEIDRVAEYAKYQTSTDGKATAYVCVNYNCDLPTTDQGKMLELLGVR